jgi:hypothetical protein
MSGTGFFRKKIFDKAENFYGKIARETKIAQLASQMRKLIRDPTGPICLSGGC